MGTHHTAVRRLSLSLVASLAGLVATPAGAASLPGAQPVTAQALTPVRPPVAPLCRLPTLAQCRDLAWRKTACGRTEMRRARTEPASTCHVPIDQDARRRAPWRP